MTATKFAHLHVHSEFSMLDGLGTVEDYAKYAAELGQPAIALTDHGNMCGAPSFYRAAREAGVEPIIGEEFYFVEDAAWRPTPGQKELPERHHVVILARDQRGYEILSELSTETHRNYYYKPLLDVGMVEALGDDAEHLVCLSGCAASIISHAVREDQEELAAEWLLWWREFMPHFYIELQHHSTDFDLQLNTGLIKLAKKFKVPHVVTNDPHYVVESDHDHHDSLLAIQTASDKNDPDRFAFDGSGYHLRSRAEMAKVFKKHYGETVWKEGAARTLEVARLCYTRIPKWETRTWHIPVYHDVEDSQAELKRLTLAGLRERGLQDRPEYRTRVTHELKAIKEVGIADFLLITLESIQWAVEQGITVGPGRGSVCGTLVGYLIGIHKIDPVKYDLLFERFLNPARPKMPDIDTDFEPSRRHELFAHVAEKYGEENCVHVAAYQNMKRKSCFRSLAKSYGVSYVDANRWAKNLSDEDTEESDWPQEVREEIFAKHPLFFDDVNRLTGVKRALAAHPAGVVIADPEHEVTRMVPQMWLASSKRMCGQYDLDAVEAIGLMKQDFLGLRTLETIRVCVDLVEKRTGKRMDPDKWIPDDMKKDNLVYEMLARGETAGVFQMEGPVNTKGIKEINPICFEDIVSCTSLYRTGAISAGFPKIFLEHKAMGNAARIKYVHDSLRPILDRTWGVVLYQEQVMEMGLVLAGFSMGEVDDIKEAIKHKKTTLMQSLKPIFIKGCQRVSGMTKEQATKCWKMIEGYAGYGYNRSHAVAYTLLTYQTARLKCLYPKEYTVALIRTVEDKEKRMVYLGEAEQRGLTIEAPDINLSEIECTPTDTGLRFGFADVSGIGEKQAAKIIAGRPEGGYTSVAQVEEAVRNAGVIKALATCGAFVILGTRGNKELASDLLNWRFVDPMKKVRMELRSQLQPPGFNGDGTVRLIGMITKKFAGTTKAGENSDGTKRKGKPYMTWHIRWDNTNEWNIRLWSETQYDERDLWALDKGDVVQINGKWEAAWENVSIGDGAKVTIVKRKGEKLVSSSGEVSGSVRKRKSSATRRAVA